MKCKKCGADLKLSDEVCPYCGAVNYAAKRHIRDRKFYAHSTGWKEPSIKVTFNLSSG